MIKQIQKYISELDVLRYEFFKRVLYILVCIIAIIQIEDKRGSYVMVGLLVFMTFQLLWIIAYSQSLLDDFFPPKKQHEIQPKRFDEIMSNRVTVVLTFVGLGFLYCELAHIQNTLFGRQLFWYGAFLGIVLAIINIKVLKQISPTICDTGHRRYSIYFGFYVGLFLLIPALGSFINYQFRSVDINCSTYTIQSKSISTSSERDAYLLKIYINGRIEDFEVSELVFENAGENKTIELCTQKGYLNYEVVYYFKPL